MTETKSTSVVLGTTPDSAVVRIYRCQKRWDELPPASWVDVRFCDHCRQEVHRVVDVDGFERAMAQVQRVMVAGFPHAETTTKWVVGQPGGSTYATTASKLVFLRLNSGTMFAPHGRHSQLA